MKPLSRFSTTQHLDTTEYGTRPADRHETHCATSGAASFIAAAATYLLQNNVFFIASSIAFECEGDRRVESFVDNEATSKQNFYFAVYCHVPFLTALFLI
jgi:hypothetical protein